MECLNIQEYDMHHVQETIEMVIYTCVCFFAPLVFNHPQMLVGTIVNCALVLSALNLRKYKLLPVILIPSLGVLFSGFVFGKFSSLLLYMIPFIWASNAILVLAFKKLFLHKKLNYWATLLLGAGVKTSFLFLITFNFVTFGVLPEMFLLSMGMLQFYTAMMGGLFAYSFHHLKKLHF